MYKVLLDYKKILIFRKVNIGILGGMNCKERQLKEWLIFLPIKDQASIQLGFSL